MDRISDKRKSMAALAVFRDLYNQKKDVYHAISEFLKLAIVENHLKSFDLHEISELIKSANGLDLPLAVVKQSLSRLKFIHKEKSQYIVNSEADLDAEQILKDTQREEAENLNIINQLYGFYESKTEKTMSEGDKVALCNEFCAFVIDDTNAPLYGEYISEFIIKQSTDKDFVEQLNQIRQGVLIFVAFSYNTNYDSIDKIDKPLSIYLDTEILFHMCGLNGAVYKRLFDEFYELVQEINRRARKKLVRLFYFSESEDEVNAFFNVAERIVRREERLDPSKQAMRSIVNGCGDPCEVIAKKTDFFQILKEKEVTLDPQERYYDKEVNYPFLIDCREFCENKDSDVTDKDIYRKVNLLNYISIKRGYKGQACFRNVGHILLSANKVTFSIASSPSVRESYTVPLATNLSFLTNRFWISLNKNLTNISALQSINIITKAQIALSTRINDNVGKLYKQYVEEDKKGKYDLEKSKACLAELHRSIVEPEELTADKAEGYMDVLSIDDIEYYIAEKSLMDAKMKEDSMRMKHEYEILQREKVSDYEKHEATIKKAANEIMIVRNNAKKDQYEIELREYENDKNKKCIDSYKKIRGKNIAIAVLYSLFIIVLYTLSVIFGKDSNILYYSVITILVGFILFLIQFIAPFLKYERIKSAFKFCLCKKYRIQNRKDLMDNYSKENPVPILCLYSLEDIIEELRNVN